MDLPENPIFLFILNGQNDTQTYKRCKLSTILKLAKYDIAMFQAMDQDGIQDFIKRLKPTIRQIFDQSTELCIINSEYFRSIR